MFGVDSDLCKKRSIFDNDSKFVVGVFQIVYDVKTFLKAADLICKKEGYFFHIAVSGSLKAISNMLKIKKFHQMLNLIK